MAGKRPESLAWLDDLDDLKAELKKDPSAVASKLAPILGKNRTKTTFLLALNNCLDPLALEKIIHAAEGNPPFTLSFNNAKVLSKLDENVADLPRVVHEVLDVAIKNDLVTLQINALVDHVISGKPAKDFDPKQVKRKTRSDKKTGVIEKTEKAQMALDQRLEEAKAGSPMEPTHPNHGPRLVASVQGAGGKPLTLGEKLGLAVEVLRGGASSGQEVAKPEAEPDPEKPAHAKSKGSTNSILVFLGGFFDITRKDFEARNLGVLSRKILIGIFKAIGHLIKWLFKVIWIVIKWPFKEAWSVVGRPVKKVVSLIILAGIVLYFGFHATFHKLTSTLWDKTTQFISSRFPNTKGSNEGTNNESSSIQNSGAIAPVEPSAIHNSSFEIQNSGPLGPVAWNPSLETELQRDNELFPIPGYCVIKPILPPVAGMDATMADNLLALLQDSHKYSVWYGNDSVTVESATANPTSLSLAFMDKGTASLDWDNLKAIHCDEIRIYANNKEKILYQCGLVSSNLEKAVEIVCPSREDFNSLVSALLYWAKNIAPSGLPYLHQGLVPDNEGKVGALWAGSPADKPGLELSDAVWGVDRDGARQLKPLDMVRRMDALKPGRHEVYVIRDAKVSPKTPRMTLEMMVPQSGTGQ